MVPLHSVLLIQVLNSRGLKCEYLEVEGEDHFTLVEKLQESDYILTQVSLTGEVGSAGKQYSQNRENSRFEAESGC